MTLTPNRHHSKISVHSNFFFLKSGFGFGLGRRHHQGWAGGAARLIVRAVFPEREQEHGEFAGDGHDGPFLFPRTARAGQALAVFAQGARRTERTEHIMRVSVTRSTS